MAAPQSEAERVRSFEPLVQRVVRRYARPTIAMSREDYLQVLRLEVVRAARRWSSSGGASIWTYVNAALVKECLNVNRDQRPRGYKTAQAQAPTVVSLDVLADAGGDEIGGSLLVDTIAGPDDTPAEAEARYRAARAWTLAEDVLAPYPRVLAALELSVGRRTTPLAQQAVANRLGVTQMSVSRWLRQARTLLLADPRSREFLEP